MKVSRNFTNTANWILDNLTPPFVRDSKILMLPLFWLLFKDKAKFFMEFKDKMKFLSKTDIIEYYRNLSEVHIQRETDLNKECIDFILSKIEGKKVLDIACGRGFLAEKIVEINKADVTGIDFIIPEKNQNSNNPTFIEGNIENIPFPDDHFETVVCTHTLEHVIDIQRGIDELRRVCKKQLIVVLPKQREYKYTFDLHVHFFPYKYSVLNLFDNNQGECLCLNNDWVYSEKV